MKTTTKDKKGVVWHTTVPGAPLCFLWKKYFAEEGGCEWLVIAYLQPIHKLVYYLFTAVYLWVFVSFKLLI